MIGLMLVGGRRSIGLPAMVAAADSTTWTGSAFDTDNRPFTVWVRKTIK